MSDYKFKIILLGNVDVGKTSIITRCVDGTFGGQEEEFDEKTKDADIDGKKVKTQFTDSAGQERFRTLTSSYFRNADALIIVYDVCDKESFEDIEGHAEEANKYLGKALKVLVGNKSDLEKKVTTEEGKSFADKHGIMFFETSAKEGANIDELYLAVIRKLMSTSVPSTGGSEPPVMETKDLHDSTSDPKKKKCILQ